MPAYEYKALKANGRSTKGMRNADSPRQLRQLLRSDGLTPVDIQAVNDRKNTAAGSRDALSWTELALVIQQLSTLLRAGLPVESALAATAQQASGAVSKRILAGIRSRVAEGQSLSAAMADFPKAFPALIRASVRAGEESGKLDAVLERLVTHTQEQQRLHREVLLALIYPVILTIVAVLVVVGLIIFVIPEIAQVFENIDQELPTLTVILIDASDFLRDHGLLTLALLMATILLIHRLLQIERIQFIAHNWLLKTPLLGAFTRHLNAARLIRTLSTLAGSGVPMLTAIGISTEVIQNRVLKQATQRMAQSVKEGGSFNQACRKEQLLPPLTQELITAGEGSGELPGMMERAASQLEDEISTRIQTLVKLFEPLLVVAMGVMVLLIVLAILLPIFEMNQMVH